MRSLKVMALGATLAVSVIGASSASAANWDPQNTNLTATGTNSTLTDTSGHSVSSTNLDAVVRASGAVASTQGVQPVVFTGNSSDISPNVTVTTFGTWTFIATNTSTVDVVAHPDASGRVATIQIHVGFGIVCDVTVHGPVNIPNSTWSNVTRTLTINNTVEFPVTQSSGCLGQLSGLSRFDASATLPIGTQIT
jgi:hypothetical protein